MRLTDLSIKKLPLTDKGQKTYYDDTLAGFGGEYPGGALYSTTAWVNGHEKEVQALTNAIMATLGWIHSHSAEDIMAKMPEDRFQNPQELEEHMNDLRAPHLGQPIHQDTVTDITPAYGAIKEHAENSIDKEAQRAYKMIIGVLLIVVVILVLMLTGK